MSRSKEFLHDQIPTECVSANTVIEESLIEYPGIAGTGFFGCFGRRVFYFTAMHCVRVGPAAPVPQLATLLIPIRHTGESTSPDDFVRFKAGYTLEQYSHEDWSDTVDLIAYEAQSPRRLRDRMHLLSRSARLPSKDWLGSYLGTAFGCEMLSQGILRVVIVGFPRGSLNSYITYADLDALTSIHTEALVIPALASPSNLPDYLAVTPTCCPYPFDGLSGSPVFASIACDHGRQYALIGMVVSGSRSTLNVIKIGKLLEAAVGMCA